MKIALLTNFYHIKEGYSLTGIVLDQCRMLHEHGHSPVLFVGENFTGDVPDYITLHKVIPRPTFIDYKSRKDITPEHTEFVNMCSHILRGYLQSFPLVLTHDFIFTGWNMPYALTMMKVAKALPHIQFLHWVHSIPTRRSDWWIISDYGVANNKIVFPNASDSQRVALQYRGHISNVEVIPHIKDLRTFFTFSKSTCDLIKTMPGLMQADFVQIYPASTDRLTAKRVDMIIKIMAELKKSGKSVCLLIANQEASNLDTYPVKREKINELYGLGEKLGLKKGIDFEFVSSIGHPNGLTKQELREAFLCSNLFIYPSREESYGLIGPEAALSGAKIMVLNDDLEMMKEVHCNTGMYESFGSYNKQLFKEVDYVGIAQRIIAEFKNNSSVQSSTAHRKLHNYDAIYKNYYEPIINDIISTQAIRSIL